MPIIFNVFQKLIYPERDKYLKKALKTQLLLVFKKWDMIRFIKLY